MAIAVIFTLATLCFSLLPVAATPVAHSTAVLPFLLGIAVTSDFVTAFLLFSQFSASRLLGTAFLGGAYVVGGLSTLAYLLSFPEVAGHVFSPQLSPALWLLWHGLFPLSVALALVYDREKRYARERVAQRRWMGAIVAGAVAMVGIPLAALIARGEMLPTLISGTAFANGGHDAVAEAIIVVNLVTLALAVMWTQGRTVLQTWLIVALVASSLDVLVSMAGTGRFTIGWYLARLLVVCSSTAVLYAYLRQIHVLFAKLSDISMIDGLTEIPNRRYFEMRLHGAIRMAQRHKRNLALVMVDVDLFKQFNDSFGHLAGDEALRAVAAALRISAKRPGDVVARWGGEEFVAILPETDREGAYLVADRLRAAVAGLAIPHPKSQVTGGIVTISLGVTVVAARDDSVTAMIERADTALYRAKQTGRNTVAVELPRELPHPATSPGLDDALLAELDFEGA